MTPIERFWARVDRTETCWLWTGPQNGNGYGQTHLPGSDGRRTRLAHRVAYERLVGPIPEGMTIDHLCRVRHCVNPTHMEVVTRGENTLRGGSPVAIHARKTHCPRGHEYDRIEVSRANSRRKCRTCMTEHMRRDRERKRQAREATGWTGRRSSYSTTERLGLDYAANGAAGKGHLAP